MFLEETNTHPSKGERPNPLRYALTRNGQSKAGNREPYVSRDPTLMKGSGDPKWQEKINRFKIYHAQVACALKQGTFSQPDDITTQFGHPFGIPWANLPEFSDLPPDNLYPYRSDFDGFFEQAHDNWHGWIDPDMADNAYTAFDPIFLSYHCNVDRPVSKFISAHPQSQFTSNFPLRPFTDSGKNLNYNDPRAFTYTTVGDMAKDTRVLGYTYALPKNSEQDLAIQMLQREGGPHKNVAPTGGVGVFLLPPISVLTKDQATYRETPATLEKLKQQLQAAVVFEIFFCTVESYTIDVFVGQSQDLAPNLETNPRYIGCITRLGMGTDIARQRCRGAPVTRVLWIEKGFEEEVRRNGIQQVVTKLPTGESVEEREWKPWKGFTGEVRWLLRAMERAD
ncbi:hypothetical protein BDW59DRAFT_157890 [Aspergillus cavernicola]|uniref:tyrosinase n=1 Tax=Aspergillus cavernicola TaxID=176166 RepID=A0ABR4IXB4_9EURO